MVARSPDAWADRHVWEAVVSRLPCAHLPSKQRARPRSCRRCQLFNRLDRLPDSVHLVSGIGASLLSTGGRKRLALWLGTVFIAANAAEFVGKRLITRPPLYAEQAGERIHVRPFDSSFPSGHMIRAVVLAACLVTCFPRTRPIALVWLTAVAVMLVVGGWHTPTDVAGGLLIASWLLISAFIALHAQRRPTVELDQRGPA